MESIAKNQLFTQIFFNEFRDQCLLFFGSLGSCFSGFLGLENKLENQMIFGDETDPE